MTKLLRLPLFLLLACSQLGFSQTTSVKKTPPIVLAAPETAGVSSERLARLDEFLQRQIAAGKAPGMTGIIVRNGKIVWQRAFGKSDLAGREMRTNDIFRIASMSKAVTATAALMLWEEGKFHLDDPISKFIPEFAKPQLLASFNDADSSWVGKPASREITVRHLLTHTSGIGYGMIDGDPRFQAIFAKAGVCDLFTDKPLVLADNIKKLAKLPLHHNPGEGFTYGEGLDVLGYLIEIWSGMTFDKFLRTRLFDPLGMTDTWFYLPHEKNNRLAPVLMPDGKGGWLAHPLLDKDPAYPMNGARTFFSGGAGLSSTALDYAVFLQMLLNDGEYDGKRYLARPTVELLTASNQDGGLWMGEKGRSYFSLAFNVVTPEGQKHGDGTPGTFSWGGYFNTHYFVDPKEKIVAVLMRQMQNTWDIETEQIWKQLVLQSVDD